MKKVLFTFACLFVLILTGCDKKMTSVDIDSIDVNKLDNVEMACWEYSIEWVQNKENKSVSGRVWGTGRDVVEELKAQLIIHKRSGEDSETYYGKTGAKDEESCEPTDKKK